MTEEEPQLFFKPLYYEGIELPPFRPLIRDAGKRIEEIRTLPVKPGDVLLSTYPKSGTHWVFEMLSMLTKGKAEYTKDMLSNFLEESEPITELEKIPSPRILVTHMPYRYLPEAHRQHGAKVIHVVRNPKDIHVSLYHYLKSTAIAQVPWNTFIDNIMNGTGKMLGGWFEFEKEYECAIKNNENIQIHTVYYEEIQKNPLEELQQIARFLEIKCDQSLLNEIVEKCRFDKMKEVDNDRSIKSHEAVEKAVEETEGFQHHPSIFRKGQVGDWRNTFTVAQNEMFNAVFEREMKGSELRIQALV